MTNNLLFIEEPKLLFGHGQSVEDPRDGLILFGPLEKGKPYGVHYGIIGTQEGIRRFRSWAERLNQPIHDSKKSIARPPFLGFETIFDTPWSLSPDLELVIPTEDLFKAIYLDDKYQRVYKTVELYSSRIIRAISEEETKVDIWFVIVPDEVHKYCRPKSIIDVTKLMQADTKMDPKYARSLRTQPSLLFQDDNINAIPYQYEVNFHNQLKARLLDKLVLTQIVRESTIAPGELLDRFGRPARGMDKLQASAAWNICTAVFYKIGGRPWKISGIREGVCYIGLVFKKTMDSSNADNACCAAQMFLDSGDGIVFRGDVGPWYNPDKGDYHLKRKAAHELIEIAVNTYKRYFNKPPDELFIHGKVEFNSEEWQGFQDAADDKDTNLVGVKIQDSNEIKLFRKSDHPILRGLAYIRSKRSAYLWTRGYIPRLQTYPGLEVPNPLYIKICRGQADIEIVLQDILALTKLNYNACVYADGVPVTLKFADAVGEILTAGPIKGDVPLPFRHYI
ncbi:MAG: hypothetical protein C3F13_16505 [Anaerolineales bacterium]|nr:hypothetical protein [Anaerolineae bacterium]PWB50553.1 MAG: hypothetical protein C3F13_16505 [Anaerolineales bacterium]